MADRISVATGIIVRAGRVLLTQRGPEQSYPLMWESPGGKVEPGETAAEALRRELREELGVDALTWKKLTVLDLDPEGHIYVARPLRVTLFDVEIGDQRPLPLQAIGIGWFSATNLLSLDLLPANDLYRGDLAVRLVRESARHG